MPTTAPSERKPECQHRMTAAHQQQDRAREPAPNADCPERRQPSRKRILIGHGIGREIRKIRLVGRDRHQIVVTAERVPQQCKDTDDPQMRGHRAPSGSCRHCCSPPRPACRRAAGTKQALNRHGCQLPSRKPFNRRRYPLSANCSAHLRACPSHRVSEAPGSRATRSPARCIRWSEGSEAREAVAHLACEFDAADASGHHDVGEDQRRPALARKPLQRFFGAVRDDGVETELIEHSRRQLGDQDIILDHQDTAVR